MVFTNNVGTGFRYLFGNTYESATVTSVIINSDDSMYVSGTFNKFNDNNVSGGIIKLFANGRVDNSFNLGGLGQYTTAGLAAIQPNGKLLVLGTFSSWNGTPFGYTRTMLRLESNGTLDNSFVTPPMNYNISQIKLLANGNILCIGGFYNVNGDVNLKRIMRLLPDGSVDTSFTTVQLSTDPSTIGVQSDGKIIIGGNFITVDGNTVNRIARLHPNGTYDNSFVGSISNAVGNSGTFRFGITILSDDRIMVGGQTGNGALFRLLPNGAPDPSFQSRGFHSNATVGPILPYNCSPNGLEEKYLIGGQFNSYDGSSNWFIVGINNDGTRNI